MTGWGEGTSHPWNPGLSQGSHLCLPRLVSLVAVPSVPLRWHLCRIPACWAASWTPASWRLRVSSCLHPSLFRVSLKSWSNRAKYYHWPSTWRLISARPSFIPTLNPISAIAGEHSSTRVNLCYWNISCPPAALCLPPFFFFLVSFSLLSQILKSSSLGAVVGFFS